METLDYFTSKIEIKPQQTEILPHKTFNYFTSKIEIKPQPYGGRMTDQEYYFTSKIEIKPQQRKTARYNGRIILHQR